MSQTYNVFANMTLLKAAGIKAPTVKSPWTWDQFRAAAKKLTSNGNFGVCWGLKSPTATIQTHGPELGRAVELPAERASGSLNVGAPEQKILTTIHDMIYSDQSVDPAGVGLSGSAVLPEFFAGKCAMTVQGNYQVQGMIQQAPKGFNWAMFPRAQGRHAEPGRRSRRRSRSPQQSQHKAEAMQFIAYALNASEHGEARGRRLADPGLPGRRGHRRQVDEALRQLAERDLGRAGPREGQLGLAQRLRSVEGADRHAGVPLVPLEQD